MNQDPNTTDRIGDLFHDLVLKPELARMHPEPLPAFQKHSGTSIAAAEAILPVVGTQRRRVYDFIMGCGPRGATDDEMQARLPMNPSTQRPRRIELVERRLIGESGMKRRTAAGRMAVVWIVWVQI